MAAIYTPRMGYILQEYASNRETWGTENNGAMIELSDDAPTNWLLKNHPDVYLAAALVWGGVFMRDTAEAAPWKSILDSAVSALAWVEARSTDIAPRAVDPALAARRGFSIVSG